MKLLKTVLAGTALSMSLLALAPGLPGTSAAKKYVSRTDLNCLARNVYHEARGEPLEGQIAVAQVTLNRVKDSRFGSTVCAVVYAPRQFSWTLNKNVRIRDQKAWEASLLIARAVLTNSTPIPDLSALYFHTPQVNPSWNRNKQVVARIGNHIFYS